MQIFETNSERETEQAGEVFAAASRLAVISLADENAVARTFESVLTDFRGDDIGNEHQFAFREQSFCRFERNRVAAHERIVRVRVEN